jgi:glycosyltransferase involved in cell wall biosynthesis
LTNFSVILPCRNEEKDIEKTLQYLQNQTIKPNEVVIVDDASTDNTLGIITRISKDQGWTVVHREKNDERYISIVNTMKLASKNLKNNFDYLVTLDGDTLLEPKYFEKILKKFESDPLLGIAGGQLKSPDDSNMAVFVKYPYNLFGSNRIYSKKCWYEINDGKEMKATTIAWDSEHSLLAQAKGFKVCRFDDIFSESVRPTSNVLPPFKRGINYYQFGYGFVFTFLHSILTLEFRYLSGYIYAKKNKIQQIGNDELLKIIKKQHNKKAYRRLFDVFSRKLTKFDQTD